MHRNTALVIVFLGLFAAAVVGVNIARLTTNPQPENNFKEENAPPVSTGKSEPTETPISALPFEIADCGISLTYPATFSKVSLENGATTFLDPASPIDATTIQCQNFLPKQYPKGSTTTTVMIGSISATLYTPPVATGSALEKKKLYFRNTTAKKDIVISGSGETFTTLFSTLTIQ